MKKRLFCICISAVLISSFVGCFNKIPDMSSKETDKVTLYMADSVLEYETHYETDYLTGDAYDEAYSTEIDKKRKLKEQLQKEADEKAAKEAEAKAAELAVNKEPVAATVYSVDELSNLMGIEDIGISCRGYGEKDMYPDADPTALSFAMKAKEGYKFVVINFELLSLSGSARDVDITEHKSGFKLKIGDDKYPVLPSALDDFGYFSGTVSSEEPTSLVLISEVPENTPVEQVQLIFYDKERKSYNINLE